MSLLKQFNNSTKPAGINENDATSAGDVAGSRGLLFNAPKSLIKRLTNDFTTDYNKKSKPKNSLLARFNSKVHEGVEDTDAGFDQSEVISKLKGLETKEKTDTRDIATLGIEDDDGQVVRVSVRNDQASEFEKALQSAIADAGEDEDAKEIAEVLYKLKDHFDIVDVEWPEVQEDEEEGDEQFGDEQGAPGTDELSDLESTGDEGNDLGDMGDAGAEPASDGGDVGGIWLMPIDMMKADAAARKADAEARIADAKAREQELGAKTALAKIKQEEQFLDMDDYTKRQKEQDKEAKRLAQLAKWKRDMGAEGNTDATDDSDMGMPDDAQYGAEEEEVRRHTSKLSAPDLAKRLIGGLK